MSYPNREISDGGRAWRRGASATGGFSLMEVLFAVLVLTLGLVFVASQFPVGIHFSSRVAETTQNAIESHNAEKSIELILSNVTLDKRSIGLDKAKGQDVNYIHFLLKPNMLVDFPGLLVVDDPEGWIDEYFSLGSNYPLVPFWSQGIINNTPFQVWTDYFLGDIGKVVCPVADVLDPAVPGRAQFLVARGIAKDLLEGEQLAIYDLAQERQYCWAALYHKTNSLFYVFTLRNYRKGTVRYAMQHPETMLFDPADPYGREPEPPRPVTPGDGEWDYNDPGVYIYRDRKFPVPWRVILDPISWDETRHRDATDGTPIKRSRWDIFSVNAEVAAVLRVGSVIIDADPRYFGPNIFITGGAGAAYKIEEIWQDENLPADRYGVRLETPLAYDDLHMFWVFPPPIIRERIGNGYSDKYEFADEQPVVDMTIKRIR